MFHENFILLLILLSFDSHLLACEIDSAKIIFYHGPTLHDFQSYDLDQLASVIGHPKFIHNQTTCYVHGFNGSQGADSVQFVVNSYLKRDTINLLTLDWKFLAGGDYLSAQHNLLRLAPRVADSIQMLFAAGLDSESFSLVGHSLGGLGVGIIGRELLNRSNLVLSRITALDPSNAAAYDDFILPPIEKTDARFVDVIHTDAGQMGSLESMGHADFWPNGGTAVQAGCPADGINDKCSHRKAWAYWAESVASYEQTQFLAYQASSYDDFLQSAAGHLRDTSEVMGIDCAASARGNYYLQIDSDYGSVPEIGLSS